MAAAKKKKTAAPLPLWLGKSISLMRGPAGPYVWVLLMVGVLFGAWYLAWGKVGDRVLSSDPYLVGLEQVQIVTPQPDWIRTDIRGEVFRNASMGGSLSVMDDQLTERIAGACSLSPWVAKVVRVTKHHPAGVEIELVYRRPVCVVEVPGDLLPVDEHGVLLPCGSRDFSAIEKSRYPRLAGIGTAPAGMVGECWGDARVIGGAEIAAALGEVWYELNLLQIVPSSPLATGVAEEPTYTLLTRGGTRVLWGRAPGTSAPGELRAAEKVARLQKYVQQHGMLDGVGGPQELDVYGLRVSSRPRP